LINFKKKGGGGQPIKKKKSKTPNQQNFLTKQWGPQQGQIPKKGRKESREQKTAEHPDAQGQRKKKKKKNKNKKQTPFSYKGGGNVNQ